MDFLELSQDEVSLIGGSLGATVTVDSSTADAVSGSVSYSSFFTGDTLSGTFRVVRCEAR